MKKQLVEANEAKNRFSKILDNIKREKEAEKNIYLKKFLILLNSKKKENLRLKKEMENLKFTNISKLKLLTRI